MALWKEVSSNRGVKLEDVIAKKDNLKYSFKKKEGEQGLPSKEQRTESLTPAESKGKDGTSLGLSSETSQNQEGDHELGGSNKIKINALSATKQKTPGSEFLSVTSDVLTENGEYTKWTKICIKPNAPLTKELTGDKFTLLADGQYKVT
eukprot:CAMPEP_0116956660 /NCGR_PEP_ID=MMETSP0467-20121206/43475_1 /TAXON_ID=283647 /ORGANISM="Mesodinium pulex, Strain SPMC105" /LENGTH=148 /DNA_ID=CAMNT_0004643195 /DNA_START=194 /DNA_END=640 /DNA_ORIENTATION=+